MPANNGTNGFASWWKCWWQLLVFAASVLVGWGIAWATLDARVDTVCVETARNTKQIETIAPRLEDLSRDMTEMKTDVRWMRESMESQHE